MSNVGHGRKYEETKSKILRAAAKLFLKNGYEKSTAKEIAAAAEINYSSIFFVFKDKEAILREILWHVLNLQTQTIEKMLDLRDGMRRFVAESVLLLCLAEGNECLREMYTVAYSLPHSPEILYRKLTEQLQGIFEKDLPKLEPKDFYEKEIAVGGILRSFICVPCDMYFTQKRKLYAFLDAVFSVYDADREKRDQAIEFALSIDVEKAAQTVESKLIKYVADRT